MSASMNRFMWVPAVAGIALLACGETPPPASPSTGELPLLISSAKPEAMPTPTAEPTPSAEPSASASASAAPAPPPPPSGDSRPPVLKSDPEEISSTFGVSPGAKLELGPEGEMAVLRIYENSFEKGVNVTFKIAKSGKSTGVVLGKIYQLTSVIPPSGTPEKIATLGKPFVLQLPAGGKKDANLAIGEIGPGKIQWKVIAPVKIDDVTNMATYELTEMSDLYLHVTTKAVTPAPK